MLICVPTTSDAGLDGAIHEHFGSAPFFTLVNTDDMQVQVLANRNTHHTHGTCHPMNQLSRFRIDAVVCTGMGRRAVEALNAEGVRTVMADAQTVGEAITQVLNGSASDIDPARACRGHGQGHVHAAPAPGAGRGAGFGQGGGRGMHRSSDGGRCGGGRGNR